LKPDFAQAFSDRGAAWYFKGEYQKAIADYDQAIRLEPDNARAYTNRGSAYRKIGRTDRALDDDTSAIRIDPTQPEFFDNRACTSPPMAITQAPSPITMKRSKYAPRRSF